MVSSTFNRPPHDILGVRPDATPYELALAKNRLMERWSYQARNGDQVALQRIKRIDAAFATMNREAIERERKAAQPYIDPAQPDTIVFPEPSSRVKLTAAEEKVLRRRIFKLVTDWNMYNTQLGNRLTRLDEIMHRHGDRYTRLRAVFQRSNMDVQTRWAAERYIRNVDHFGSAFGLKGLHAQIREIQAQARVPGALSTLTIPHVELAEHELGERMAHLDEAFEIMDRKRQYISFMVPN